MMAASAAVLPSAANGFTLASSGFEFWLISMVQFLNQVFVGFHYCIGPSRPGGRPNDGMVILGLRDKPASGEPGLSRTIEPGRNKHEIRTAEEDGPGCV
jgi:hypothetical protein